MCLVSKTTQQIVTDHLLCAGFYIRQKKHWEMKFAANIFNNRAVLICQRVNSLGKFH